MTDYLLPLASLHAAAPGVLDVVFGPDGAFEGAPRFTGPIWHPRWGRYLTAWRVTHDRDGEPRVWVRSLDVGAEPDDDAVTFYALDLRIPSIASRLAGLCARAVLPDDPKFVGGPGVRRMRGGLWVLYWRDADGLGKDASWTPDGRRGHIYDSDVAGSPFASPEHFLAALTLTLAPRIAALRSTP